MKMILKIKVVLLLAILLGSITLPQKSAYAFCCSCVCDRCVNPRHTETRNHITNRFENHQNWILATLWYDNVLPAMMMMTNQMSAVAMQQVQIIGSFMDAQMQMETQRLLQQLQAEAHKDYHPSEGICTIGTGVRSLASSERKAELTTTVMSRRMIDRMMRNQNTVAASPEQDAVARIRQFKDTYCNPRDNNAAFLASGICSASTNPERHNSDIDFTRVMDIPMTLEVDFSDTVTSPDEEDILAMSAHLFGNDTLAGVIDLAVSSVDDDDSENFLDYRALLAKRSIAQNSFASMVGMKSAGSGIGITELSAILEELGVPPAEVVEILGANPSYYAQMELLTKKIFQNPSFYINLYDKPANVHRKGVALQALQLMLMNDTFNSNLRQEMILAIALETELDKVQEGIQARIGTSN